VAIFLRGGVFWMIPSPIPRQGVGNARVLVALGSLCHLNAFDLHFDTVFMSGSIWWYSGNQLLL